MRQQNIKSGFTLVGIMVALLVVTMMIAASVPVITKKARSLPARMSHGKYVCYRDINGNLVEETYNATRITGQRRIDENAGEACSFTPPERAALFKIELVGAGAGGFDTSNIYPENLLTSSESTNTFDPTVDRLDASNSDITVDKPITRELLINFLRNAQYQYRSRYIFSAASGGDIKIENAIVAGTGTIGVQTQIDQTNRASACTTLLTKEYCRSGQQDAFEMRDIVNKNELMVKNEKFGIPAETQVVDLTETHKYITKGSYSATKYTPYTKYYSILTNKSIVGQNYDYDALKRFNKYNKILKAYYDKKAEENQNFLDPGYRFVNLSQNSTVNNAITAYGQSVYAPENSVSDFRYITYKGNMDFRDEDNLVIGDTNESVNKYFDFLTSRRKEGYFTNDECGSEVSYSTLALKTINPVSWSDIIKEPSNFASNCDVKNGNNEACCVKQGNKYTVCEARKGDDQKYYTAMYFTRQNGKMGVCGSTKYLLSGGLGAIAAVANEDSDYGDFSQIVTTDNAFKLSRNISRDGKVYGQTYMNAMKKAGIATSNYETAGIKVSNKIRNPKIRNPNYNSATQSQQQYLNYHLDGKFLLSREESDTLFPQIEITRGLNKRKIVAGNGGGAGSYAGPFIVSTLPNNCVFRVPKGGEKLTPEQARNANDVKNRELNLTTILACNDLRYQADGGHYNLAKEQKIFDYFEDYEQAGRPDHYDWKGLPAEPSKFIPADIYTKLVLGGLVNGGVPYIGKGGEPTIVKDYCSTKHFGKVSYARLEIDGTVTALEARDLGQNVCDDTEEHKRDNVDMTPATAGSGGAIIISW